MKLLTSCFLLGKIMLTSNSGFAVIAYKDCGVLPFIANSIFERLDIRIGTLKSVVVNKKSRVPSFLVKMDFGDDVIFFDKKGKLIEGQSSAQLQDNYLPGKESDEEGSELLSGSEYAADTRKKAYLEGIQVAAVTNFPVMSVGVSSYFLTLGVVSLEGETAGTVVVIPVGSVANGSKVKLLNDDAPSVRCSQLEKVNPQETFHHLDVRVGSILSLEEKKVDFGEKFGVFEYQGIYPLFREGMQVLRVFNLEDLRDADNFLGVVNEERTLIPLTLERKLPNGRFLK